MLKKLFLLRQKRLFAIFYAWVLALVLHLIGAVALQDPYGASGQSIFSVVGLYLIPAYFGVSLAYTAFHALRHFGDHDMLSNRSP